MAEKKFKSVHINLNYNQLIKALIYPLSTSARNALAPSVNEKGLLVFDTDILQLFAWTGTSWSFAVTPSAGAMIYAGPYSNLTVEPSGSLVGDTYVWNGSTGTLTWAGITFGPSATVQSGDLIIKRNANNYDVIQGNTVDASPTVKGVIQLATSTEVIVGTDAVKAVTPATLKIWRGNQGVPYSYQVTVVSLVAATPSTITHNLALTHKDNFIVRAADSSGATINLSSESVDANSFTITSSINLSNVRIFVLGY